jgi:hypothetical protein
MHTIVDKNRLDRGLKVGVGMIAFALIASCISCGGGGETSTSAPIPVVSSTAINLMLNSNRISGVAPLAVSFDTLGTTATNTSLPFHEMKFTWAFNDPAGVSTWAYGAKANLASKNVAYGPVAAHVFENVGTYTITVTGFDGVNTSSATKVITVTSPAALSTVCVSNTALPVAGAGGCPTGAGVQLMPTWATVGTLADTYKRILLKSGDVWVSTGAPTLGASRSNGIIDSYGTGAKPKIIMSADTTILNVNQATNWKFLNFEITGDGVQGANKNGITINGGGNHLLMNLDISDMHIGIGSSNTNGLVIANSFLRGMYNNDNGFPGIAMFLENTDNLAILGSRFSDSPFTHVVRIQGTQNCIVSNNHIDLAGPTRNALSIRGKTTSNAAVVNGVVPWNGLWTENVVISDNFLDNSVRGGFALYAGPQSVNHGERVRNVLIERNYVKGKEQYASDLSVAENLTVRNNIFSSYYNYTFGLGLGGNNAGSPPTTNAFIYNNIFYKPDISSTASMSAVSLSGVGSATGISLKNNLAYGLGNTRDGAGNGSKASFVSFIGGAGASGVNYTLGNNSTDLQINTIRPWSATSPVIAADFSPVGYPINAAVAVPFWSDYFNSSITVVKNMGPIIN